MNLKKLFNSLTDSSKVLLTVGGISFVLDLVGKGELDEKFAAGLGMLMWLGIMVYQNQCLGPRNCSNYSWLLVVLLVIGMLVKMYYVNVQGLSRNEFKTMLDSSNYLPNNDVEKFGSCSGRRGEENCGSHAEGFNGCSGRRGEESHIEGFTSHDDEEEPLPGELIEGFAQLNTST
jgi:hypothetical protein